MGRTLGMPQLLGTARLKMFRTLEIAPRHLPLILAYVVDGSSLLPQSCDRLLNRIIRALFPHFGVDSALRPQVVDVAGNAIAERLDPFKHDVFVTQVWL